MSITLPQPQDPEPGLALQQPTAGPAADPMRLAVVAPPWFELPPVGYGGTEAVVAALVDTLVDRGHDVTLIASGRHRTRAQHFIPIYDEPPSSLLGTPMPEVHAAAVAAEALADLDVDLVHDHSLAGPLLARSRQVPTVATLHGPSTGHNGDYFERLGRSVDVVAISEAQQRLNPRLNWVGVVHNAIDVSSFPFVDHKDDFVLWLGRFSPDKGAHLAIDAARKAGRRIVLAGKCNEPEEKAYFRDRIAPRLGPDVSYVGEADAVLKRELFGKASCLAFPIQWEEPFGMVMVEAMACGTPVVALRRGSVPEVVADGVSGIVVDRVEELAGAIDRAGDLSPFACRRHATERFDLPVMAAGYEQIFRMLAEGSRGLRDLTVARPA
jgi:glycosyltransferase involved in cell wall biosynthesis